MTSKIMKAFLSISNMKHTLGAALTPRHQGLCERNPQVMIGNQLLLMHEVGACVLYRPEVLWSFDLVQFQYVAGIIEKIIVVPWELRVLILK